MSDRFAKLAGRFQNLVERCPVTDFYFQHCILRAQNLGNKVLAIKNVCVLTTEKLKFFSVQ